MNTFLEKFRKEADSRTFWDNLNILQNWLEANFTEDQMDVIEEYVQHRIDQLDYDSDY